MLFWTRNEKSRMWTWSTARAIITRLSLQVKATWNGTRRLWLQAWLIELLHHVIEYSFSGDLPEQTNVRHICVRYTIRYVHEIAESTLTACDLRSAFMSLTCKGFLGNALISGEASLADTCIPLASKCWSTLNSFTKNCNYVYLNKVCCCREFVKQGIPMDKIHFVTCQPPCTVYDNHRHYCTLGAKRRDSFLSIAFPIKRPKTKTTWHDEYKTASQQFLKYRVDGYQRRWTTQLQIINFDLMTTSQTRLVLSFKQRQYVMLLHILDRFITWICRTLLERM